MKIKNFYCAAILLAVGILCGCDEKEDVGVKPDINFSTIDFHGVAVENRNGTLVFSSVGEMKNALEKVADIQPEHVLTRGGVLESVPLTKGFQSFYDLFSQAMNEAEDYYERIGGYEEFKDKYPMFYYPEEGDDYSAYLPVSDRNMAKIADQNGNVIIGSELVSLKDVQSYEQLKELGRTPPPDEDFTVKSGVTTRTDITGINFIGVIYGDNSKNKVWATASKSTKNGNPAIHIEVCFRKKNFAGIWYNHSSTSVCTTTGSLLGAPIINSTTGFSSHDRTYERYLDYANYAAVGYGAVNGMSTINHHGTGKTLYMTLSFPSLY
jgi:hypothetical protein